MQKQFPEVQVQDNLQEKKILLLKLSSKREAKLLLFECILEVWVLTGYFIELIGIKTLDACKVHVSKITSYGANVN